MKIMGMKETLDIKDVICDKCGKSCKPDKDYDFEYATLNANWGYYSNYDSEWHSAHFCVVCYEWLYDILKANGVTMHII